MNENNKQGLSPLGAGVAAGWKHPHEVPDALANKALAARVPGGSSVRDWFLPHEADKARENVLMAMKCALLATLPEAAAQEGDSTNTSAIESLKLAATWIENIKPEELELWRAAKVAEIRRDIRAAKQAQPVAVDDAWIEQAMSEEFDRRTHQSSNALIKAVIARALATHPQPAANLTAEEVHAMLHDVAAKVGMLVKVRTIVGSGDLNRKPMYCLLLPESAPTAAADGTEPSDGQIYADVSRRAAPAAASPLVVELPEGPAYGIIDPDYARYYSIIRCTAWQYGYAIGMHGSFTRDLDLIAVPWTDEACDPEKLVKVICGRTDLTQHHKNPTAKPHGRQVYTLMLPGAGDPRWIDLSVLPRAAVALAVQTGEKKV